MHKRFHIGLPNRIDSFVLAEKQQKPYLKNYGFITSNSVGRPFACLCDCLTL